MTGESAEAAAGPKAQGAPPRAFYLLLANATVAAIVKNFFVWPEAEPAPA